MRCTLQSKLKDKLSKNYFRNKTGHLLNFRMWWDALISVCLQPKPGDNCLQWSICTAPATVVISVLHVVMACIMATDLIHLKSSFFYKIDKHLNSCWDSRRGYNSHGPKSGGWFAPFRGGAASPSNTVSPAPRPIAVPSGILIHPAVWQQCTNVTDRQDR